MDLDIEEPAILAYPYLRRAGHRGQKRALFDDAEPAWPLGDEEFAVGKERDAPGGFEILGHDLELDRLLLGFEDRALRIDLRFGLALELAGLIANVEHELPDLLLGDEVLEGRHRRSRASVADARRDARIVAAELPVLVHEARGGATLERRPVTRGAELRDEPGRRVASSAAARTWLGGSPGGLGRWGRRRRRRGWILSWRRVLRCLQS